MLVAALIGFCFAHEGNAAGMAALAATFAFVAQAALLGGALLRDGIWRPSVSSLRPIAASLAASAIMLAVLELLLRLLAGPLAFDQPALHRVGALSLLCLAGLATYGAAGWTLGAFGALPLRKRRG